jgi:hypothetical protein
MLEVMNRRTLTKKFRIGDYTDIGIGVDIMDNPLNLITGPNGNGRFGNNNRIGRDRRRDLTS